MRKQLLLTASKLAAQAFVLYGAGLQVLCADDYLRVWLAHRIAHAWTWFPDSIFLPAFFWAYSLPVKFGIPLRAGAVGLTVSLSVLLTLLLYRLSKRAGASEKTAFFGTLLWMLQPMALWLNAVPLSETLSAALLLLGIECGFSGRRSVLFAGGLSLALASLTRYELWPVVGLLFLLEIKPKPRWLYALPMPAGIAAVAVWRASQPLPLGPAAFVYAEVVSAAAWKINGWRVLYGTFGFLPLSAFVLPGFLRNIGKWNRISAAAAASLVSTAAVFAAGYFPITFPSRLAFIPLTLAAAACLGKWNRVLDLLPLRVWICTGVSSAVLFLALARHPQAEVASETLKAAEILKNRLAVTRPDEKILVQKADLGWTTLWGLTDADPRIVFDRERISEPGLLASPSEARAYFSAHPETACTLLVSKPGRIRPDALDPAGWRTLWKEGKYTFRCAKNQTER